MIVIGVTSNSLRERLLRMDNLNLENAVKLGQAAEVTKKHAYELCRSRENQTIDALKWNPNNIKSKSENNESNPQLCKHCGMTHKHRKCPAYGKTCLKCNKLNHFASVCLMTKKRIDYTQTKPQHEGDNEDFFIGIVDQSELCKDTSNGKTDFLGKMSEIGLFRCCQMEPK